jgi:hypothetical protein
VKRGHWENEGKKDTTQEGENRRKEKHKDENWRDRIERKRKKRCWERKTQQVSNREGGELKPESGE